MSTQGARHCEVGRCHAKSTSFEVISVLTAVWPYNSLASPSFSILLCSVGISTYTLQVVIRIQESRVLDDSEWMLISTCYGCCGPHTGDKKGINVSSCFLPAPPPLPGRTSYRYACLYVAAGSHRTNIYNSEYLRVPQGEKKTLIFFIKYMYYFSLFFHYKEKTLRLVTFGGSSYI